MEKVFVLYRLREGVTPEEFATWSREVDQRITPREEGCIRFEVYAMRGAQGGEPRYQVVEDIEVESWEVWEKTLQGEGMSRVAEDFPKYVDESSVELIYGKRII